MSSALFSRRQVLAGPILALTLLAGGGLQTSQAGPTEGQRAGLQGYCPVCVIDARKWEKGSPAHQTTYDGVTYHFPNDAIKQMFLANPAKYVPALGGDCIVCYAKLGKRVPGSIHHSARRDNRLFLFPSDKERDVFLKGPQEFADVDLALNGDCAVCLVHASKRVPGKPEYTEIHNGFRYQFPSPSEQAAFRKDPARYAAAGSKQEGKESQKSEQPAAKDSFTATGKTICAFCEHGVTPIQNPDELGLAVHTSDGKVIVVEQAHKLYPSAYSNRYAGEKVRVSGRVIKEENDRFIWIEPTELTVLK